MQGTIVQGFRQSPQQRHVWLLQREAQSPPYRVQGAVLIEGTLDTEILKTALQHVIERHEILRTAFRRLPGMTIPLQVISNSDLPIIADYNLSNWGREEQEAEIEALFQEGRRQPFDFEQGRLWQASMITLSPGAHLLLIGLSALCADARTLKNLVDEISRCYAACLRGERLSDQPAQYVDLCEVFNRLLEAEDTKAGIEYWRQQDIAAFLDSKLPLENHLAEEAGFEPDFLSLTIDSEVVAEMEALVRKYKVPASEFLLACWQILLRRITDLSELVIGLACDGRSYDGLEKALGLFAKYAPVRASLREDHEFRDILRQVSRSTREAYQRQEYFSWEHLFGFNESKAGPPFCQLSFDFASRDETSSVAGVKFSIYQQYTCIDRFKLKLSCVRKNESLIAEFHYDSILFQAGDVRQLAERFHKLLESVIRNPFRPIDRLEILSHSEKRQLLVEFNDTKTDYPQGKCLHELFEDQVQRAPDNIAAVFEDGQLTYAELNARSNQLAHRLRALGVGPEVLVALCIERSLEMVVGLLGALKAGGAYVPLDPAYPKERLTFMLEDSRARVLLTQERFLSGLPHHSSHYSPHYRMDTVCLDRDWETISRESRRNPTSGVTPDALTYIIYTSGSTGKPKGVMITHQSLGNHMFWMQTDFPLTDADIVLQKTPFSFDASIWEFYAPLLAGARLILAQPEGHQDSGYLVRLMRKERVTIVQLVPTLLQQLVDEPELHTCVDLRRVFCGGEALSVELQQRFYTRLSENLINLYGPTEATIDSIFWICRPENNQLTVPIGRPIANMQTYVLDRHLQLEPIGVVGELHLGGDSLGRGYLNRPELTAEKFIPHPFSDDPGALLYKTGDLVSYQSNGVIQFLGRTDHHVKLRGFRVELGEIEVALSRHPAVRDAVVLVREDAPGDKRLVAYFVAKEEARINTGELRRFLQGKLPDHMVASVYVELATLPLAPNGKVDRQALPAPSQVRPELEAAFVAPRTPVEECLVQIWREFLRVDRIGVHDNFFNLGGHSLLLTRIASRIREVFQVDLPLRVYFDNPTVADMTVAIAASQANQADPAEIAQILEELKQLSPDEAKTLLVYERSI